MFGHRTTLDAVETDSAALAMHAAEVVGEAWGRCLSLLPSADAWGPLPPTVGEVVSLDDGSGDVDSMVSVGQLGTARRLTDLLTELLGRAAPNTELLFCEPTITADTPPIEAPHDVTNSLWATGWSVVDCHRYRVGRGRRAQQYVWGRARPMRQSSAGRPQTDQA